MSESHASILVVIQVQGQIKIGDDMNILNFCKRPAWVLVLIALTLYVSSAQAHLKWFVDDSQQAHIYNNLIFYSLTWVSIGVVLILVGILIDRIYPKISASWQPKLIEKYATSILGILVGISLIISALGGNLFSMNIKGSGALHTTLLLVEGFIGVSLIIGLAVRQASLLLMALWLVVTQVAGLAVTLENLWVLGVAIFFCYAAGQCYAILVKMFFIYQVSLSIKLKH